MCGIAKSTIFKFHVSCMADNADNADNVLQPLSFILYKVHG